jgi:acyl-CoA thioesterase FadM
VCCFVQTARIETLGWGGPKYLIPIQKHIDEEYHTPEKLQQETRRVVVVVRSSQVVYYDESGRAQSTDAGYVQLPYCVVLRVTSEIAEVRQRSLTIQHDVYTPENKRIATMWTTCVAMDALAGRAVPLPPSLVNLSTKLIPETIMGTYKVALFPDIRSNSTPYRVAYEYKSDPFLVGVSFTDPLGHVNQSRYSDWYEDNLYAICHRTSGPTSAEPLQIPPEYLKIAKDSLFRSGRVHRIEYIQETLPSEWIMIRVRWIFNRDQFYALWFDTITPSGAVKNQMITIFGRELWVSKL